MDCGRAPRQVCHCIVVVEVEAAAKELSCVFWDRRTKRKAFGGRACPPFQRAARGARMEEVAVRKRARWQACRGRAGARGRQGQSQRLT